MIYLARLASGTLTRTDNVSFVRVCLTLVIDVYRCEVNRFVYNGNVFSFLVAEENFGDQRDPIQLGAT